MPAQEKSIINITAAWMVHLFTASGALFGLLAMQAACEKHFVAAIAWMMVTSAIDGVDGALARWRRVKTVLPHFDGALLDNMVDYFTFVLVPAFFLLYADLLPPALRLPLAGVILIASAYQFSRDDAKTADHTFTGFPSYWNVAVFYLFLLDWGYAANTLILLLCAAGVFVRIRYLYPSRTRFLRPINIGLGMAWAGLCIAALARYPEGHQPLLYASFFYLVYYLAVSLWLTLRKPPAPTDCPDTPSSP